MLVKILYNMDTYTITVKQTTNAEITTNTNDTVRLKIPMDHALSSNLEGHAMTDIYLRKIVSYVPKLDIAADIQYVHYIMTNSTLLSITDRWLSSGDQVECNVVFNLWCNLRENIINRVEVIEAYHIV